MANYDTRAERSPVDAAALLEVRGLGKSYVRARESTDVLDSIDLSVHEGEFVCVVGPSGCGKTTLLNCLSGLLRPSRGELLFEGVPITGPPENLAVVFQDYTRSLLPWMTNEQNVDLPLRKHLAKGERRVRVREALAHVGLSGNESVYPWQLSGGMQQRVAIARALAFQPDIMLMDEPFAAVDAQTRIELEDLMLAVQAQYGGTVVFVTHDIDEAIYLATKVVVLSGSPTTVRDVVEVDLPTPRDQVETKAEPRFSELRGHVFKLIQEAKRSQRAASEEVGGAAPLRSAEPDHLVRS
jgi:NitT/TauT family transport system ATP-binding protein